MSRPPRKGSGSNKPRPQAAKRPAGQQAAKPASTTAGPAAAKGGAKPGAKSGATPGATPGARSNGKPSAEPSAKSSARPAVTRPTPSARARAAITVPGRTSWATSASLPALAGVLVGLFVLGLLVGVGGALVHYMRVGSVPTGTLLGVLAADGVAFAAGVLLRSRFGAAIPGLGWLVAGMLLSSPRGEGDLLIGGAAMDYGFLVGGVGTLLAVCALPYGLLAVTDDPDASR